MKLTKVDLINIAKGIVEWRLDEGKEQDGRHGVIKVRLDDFLNDNYEIKLTEDEYEEVVDALYDVAATVQRAAEKAVENYITNAQKAQDMQRLMDLYLKQARSNILVIDDMEEMTRISLKWSEPHA